MAKYTGKSMALTFGAFSFPSGTLTSVDIPRSRSEFEATGAGQTDKEFFPMEREATVTINAWDDVAGTIRAAFEFSTNEATLTFYPQGNTTGKPSISASAFVTQISAPVTHNQVTPITITLRVNGAVTFGTVA